MKLLAVAAFIFAAAFLAGCATCAGVEQSADLAGGTGTFDTHAVTRFDWSSNSPALGDQHSFQFSFDDGSMLNCDTNAFLAGSQPLDASQLGCVFVSGDVSFPLTTGIATPISGLDRSGNGTYEIRFDVPATPIGGGTLTLDGLIGRATFHDEACGGGGHSIWGSM
jgi:hypothetical protein